MVLRILPHSKKSPVAMTILCKQCTQNEILRFSEDTVKMSGTKQNSYSSKTSSYRFTNSRSSSAKSIKPRISNPRRIIPSKKVPLHSTNHRTTVSGDLLHDSKNKAKTKKTTKCDFSVKNDKQQSIDLCKNCGDIVTSSVDEIRPNSDLRSVRSVSTTIKSSKIARSAKTGKSNSNFERIKRTEPQSVQQYFINENYQSEASTEEITNGVKKVSLDTIKEVSEYNPSDSIFKICPDDCEDITFVDLDDDASLKRLKEFRQKNYFECHSAKSRINNRGSATSLHGHTCVYRFYLNDRLFPVPLNTDHNNQVRCVECHLPMQLNVDEATKINGTIQAKVTIGKKNEDIMLLLPVKEPLIITEKRKENKEKNTEVVFFGVINLDGFGNSLFNSTLPGNSLALKYQKGYREFVTKEKYNYRNFDKGDVIVI